MAIPDALSQQRTTHRLLQPTVKSHLAYTLLCALVMMVMFSALRLALLVYTLVQGDERVVGGEAVGRAVVHRRPVGGHRVGRRVLLGPGGAGHGEAGQAMAIGRRGLQHIVGDMQEDAVEVIARLFGRDRELRLVDQPLEVAGAEFEGVGHLAGGEVGPVVHDPILEPADIKRLLDKLDEGYDVVSGWRKNRQDKMVSRRIPSQIANKIISWIGGVPLHDYGCSLKVFRAEVVKSMKLYGEMHRFLPAIAAEQGVEIVEHVVNHRKRLHGTSKYGISRTIRVILDLLTVKFLLSYSTRPLQVFGLYGVIMGAVGTLVLAAAWAWLSPAAVRAALS